MTVPRSLYRPGVSVIHRLHPLTKLVFSLFAITVIFGGPGAWLSAVSPGLLAIFLLRRAGLLRQAARLILRLLTPLILVLFLIHGFFHPENQTILFQIGSFRLGQEGLAFAGLIATRLVATLAVSLLLVMSTHPAHLVQALAEAGIPYGLAYLLGSPLLLLPQMAERIHTIRAAQQSRGLETQGNILQRIRALLPLVSPLIFSALVDVEERSLALEVHGFRALNPKTSLFELPDSPMQRAARRIFVVLVVVTLVGGIWWRANAGR